ncbi:copine (Calcium-dependent phospholipid-binding protein) family [Artemisia annua]|uniref:Copine (Calcium-dependent phospholipid-binding protein) family n=1 Tax=Artemisia annua TaxID=35608 RepID=A0A2U1M7P2_ARTAN|nr:copine (Calcium-dependent phospholipid-binding protein) family [Artemisia annua]
MSMNVPLNRKAVEFALSGLMEIPSQYKATIELNLLGNIYIGFFNEQYEVAELMAQEGRSAAPRKLLG